VNGLATAPDNAASTSPNRDTPLKLELGVQAGAANTSPNNAASTSPRDTDDLAGVGLQSEPKGAGLRSPAFADNTSLNNVASTSPPRDADNSPGIGLQSEPKASKGAGLASPAYTK
jgi:hypothetical protein